MSKSCAGCKFLYQQDEGYSNYTVTDSSIICAKDKNPNLPAEAPYDWNGDPANDNWTKTNQSRCDLYAAGKLVRLDVDGESGPADDTDDAEAIAAICASSGRQPHGER